MLKHEMCLFSHYWIQALHLQSECQVTKTRNVHFVLIASVLFICLFACLFWGGTRG
jgi:hypothetical protein